MFELAPFALSADYVESVLPIDQVKSYLSIEPDETEFDDQLPIYAAAAVDQVERYCGLALAPKTGREWRAEALPRQLVLPGPNAVVTSVVYLDTIGANRAIDIATLRLGIVGQLLPRPGYAWPTDIGGGLVVTFDAGFPAGECPPLLKQAALTFAAHLFANREAVLTGTISGEIPLGFRNMCAPFRPVTI